MHACTSIHVLSKTIKMCNTVMNTFVFHDSVLYFWLENYMTFTTIAKMKVNQWFSFSELKGKCSMLISDR